MSKNILIVDSSPLGDASASRKLTRETAATFQGAAITHRDLDADPLPHLSAETVAAFFTPPDTRSAALKDAIRRSDAETDLLLAADILVIGAPMWNFGIPSALKAWIDHIVRAGRTFSFSAGGAFEGLARNKKAIIVIASGGYYGEPPMKAMDHVEPYLRDVLGFIGITDVTFVRAEGQSRGAEAAAKELDKARTTISKLAA